MFSIVDIKRLFIVFIGPGKVYSYFGGGYNDPPKRNRL